MVIRTRVGDMRKVVFYEDIYDTIIHMRICKGQSYFYLTELVFIMSTDFVMFNTI